MKSFWFDEETKTRMMKCDCGEILPVAYAEHVYDDCGCYAGRFCTYQCAEEKINLHMTRQDYAECGESLDDY